MQHENGWRLVAPKNADQHAVVIRGYSKLDMVVQHIRGEKGITMLGSEPQDSIYQEGGPYTGTHPLLFFLRS